MPTTRPTLKNLTLIIAIVTGIAAYFIYAAIPILTPTRPYALKAVSIVQPMLIFAMLLLTFCRIEPRRLRLKRWHWWLLIIQGVGFTGIGLFLIILPHSSWRIMLEGTMILLICPTATAAAIITRKLGGDINNITTYTILINITAALLIPAIVPLVHPSAHTGILATALTILAKVFPLLLLPLGIALALRKWLPKAWRYLAGKTEVSFYLWAIALALATAVTARQVVHSDIDAATMLGLIVASLLCCIFQFWIGRKIGRRHGDHITAGQSLGQKNTVLAIWLGYTFFTPITAVAGGFYSIWHNLVNSWQLYKSRFDNKC